MGLFEVAQKNNDDAGGFFLFVFCFQILLLRWIINSVIWKMNMNRVMSEHLEKLQFFSAQYYFNWFRYLYRNFYNWFKSY